MMHISRLAMTGCTFEGNTAAMVRPAPPPEWALGGRGGGGMGGPRCGGGGVVCGRGSTFGFGMWSGEHIRFGGVRFETALCGPKSGVRPWH